jgi:uncharacterized membrane protein YqjE
MTTTDTDYQLPTLGRLARRTAGTLIGALENRAELFTIEFQEESDRLVKVIIFGVSSVLLAMIAVLLITGTIIFLVPEPYRIYAAGGFAALYVAGTVALVLTALKLSKVPPFAESLKQVKKDAELLEAFK